MLQLTKALVEFLLVVGGESTRRLVETLQLLNASSEQYAEVCRCLVASLEFYEVDARFLCDAKTRLSKIKSRVQLSNDCLQSLGGAKGIEALLQEMASLFKTEECFHAFLKQFHEENVHLVYVPVDDFKPRKDKLEARGSELAGFSLLRFILATSLTTFDCSSHTDFRSGKLYFGVGDHTVTNWHLCLRMALRKLYPGQQQLVDAVGEIVRDMMSVASQH